jgi:hypothetical protein
MWRWEGVDVQLQSLSHPQLEFLMEEHIQSLHMMIGEFYASRLERIVPASPSWSSPPWNWSWLCSISYREHKISNSHSQVICAELLV